MKVSLLILSACLTLFTPAKPHKYYVGHCQIETNSSKKRLEITIRLFDDDVEKAFEKNGRTLQFINRQPDRHSFTLLQDYLTTQFKIYINQKPTLYKLHSVTNEDQVIVFYLSVSNCTQFVPLQIRNTLLTETFPDQQHLIVFKNGNTSQSETLNRDQVECTFL
ncbi:MAG: hypothetical protein CFE24_03370 [Flavobacterium sp. BFFFF2]|nr:MAG: hypothetical protein CFE24_03370 [Flavobacterium sp. BFFFF2]